LVAHLISHGVLRKDAQSIKIDCSQITSHISVDAVITTLLLLPFLAPYNNEKAPLGGYGENLVAEIAVAQWGSGANDWGVNG